MQFNRFSGCEFLRSETRQEFRNYPQPKVLTTSVTRNFVTNTLEHSTSLSGWGAQNNCIWNRELEHGKPDESDYYELFL